MSFLKYILAERKETKRKLINRALKGEARPWTEKKTRWHFQQIRDKREKVLYFNDNISRIFPLILQLYASGLSLPQIEKSLHLTPRFLWQWLKVRPRLMEEVRKAKGLRYGTKVLHDEEGSPLDRD